MTVLVLAVIGFALALVPAVLFFINLRLFTRLPLIPEEASHGMSPVSVLIPARNEEHSIQGAIRCVLANTGFELELIILDDHSDDATAQRVNEIARSDSRVRLAGAPPLPPDWCGKQYACHVLSQLARHDLMVWIDADVRLQPDTLARMASAIADRRVGLLSGFPRQQTGTLLERLLIPLIHFILLGYLPLGLMRRSPRPSFSAGCGQLMMVRRTEYVKSGGHAAIRASFHDGIKLPRSLRGAGVMTDIFDATDVAECRMYHSAASVWCGLLKNAAEGMAAPRAIVPWTVLLLGGQLLPPVLAIVLIGSFAGLPAGMAAPYCKAALTLSVLAWGSSVVVRLVGAARFRQSWVSAAAHPIGVLLLVAIQWHSLILRVLKKPSTWKGRLPPVPS